MAAENAVAVDDEFNSLRRRFEFLVGIDGEAQKAFGLVLEHAGVLPERFKSDPPRSIWLEPKQQISR